jgi:type IV pilus assembly protein PilM
MMGFFALLMFWFIVVIALWIFTSYALYQISRRFETGSMLAYCIPVYNAYLLCKAANIPLWNTAVCFVPILNIGMWGSIAEKLGKSYWLYGISIGLLWFPMFILAFGRSSAARYDSFEKIEKEEQPEKFVSVKMQETEKYIEAKMKTQEEPVKYEKKIEEPVIKDIVIAVEDADKTKPLNAVKKYTTKKNIMSMITKLPIVSSFTTKQFDQLVGVDIGTTSIKICTLKNTKGFFTVQHAIVKAYENDLLSDGHIIDVSFLAEELKMLFDENKIKSRNVACALSSYSVISKKITIPVLQEEELENTISMEVENAIPFPLRDIYYSYYVMGIDPEKQNMMDVKIVAAKKEIVDAYIAVFNMADMSLQLLDVDIFDVSNLVEQIYSPKDASVVIVDIGASVTNIAILNGENIEFTREILMGGKYLTSMIQKSVRLNYHDAEAKKMSADSSIIYLFEDFIFNIASEINKTVRFYLATKPKENIGKVYITGGASLLPGLKEKIVEDTGIQVEVIDPFLLVQPDNTQIVSYEEMKEFMVVPLSLSARITDLMI